MQQGQPLPPLKPPFAFTPKDRRERPLIPTSFAKVGLISPPPLSDSPRSVRSGSLSNSPPFFCLLSLPSPYRSLPCDASVVVRVLSFPYRCSVRALRMSPWTSFFSVAWVIPGCILDREYQDDYRRIYYPPLPSDHSPTIRAEPFRCFHLLTGSAIGSFSNASCKASPQGFSPCLR